MCERFLGVLIDVYSGDRLTDITLKFVEKNKHEFKHRRG